MKPIYFIGSLNDQFFIKLNEIIEANKAYIFADKFMHKVICDFILNKGSVSYSVWSDADFIIFDYNSNPFYNLSYNRRIILINPPILHEKSFFYRLLLMMHKRMPIDVLTTIGFTITSEEIYWLYQLQSEDFDDYFLDCLPFVSGYKFESRSNRILIPENPKGLIEPFNIILEPTTIKSDITFEEEIMELPPVTSDISSWESSVFKHRDLSQINKNLWVYVRFKESKEFLKSNGFTEVHLLSDNIIPPKNSVIYILEFNVTVYSLCAYAHQFNWHIVVSYPKSLVSKNRISNLNTSILNRRCLYAF